MGKSKEDWSGRKFITTIAGAGTIIILNPPLSWTVVEGMLKTGFTGDAIG